MKGTFLVSLDLELFWGMLDICPLEDYQENVLGGRKAIPRLLALFEKYGIHATWAAVGFLFAENRQELEAFFPEETLLPTYDKQDLTPYAWFDRIGTDENEAPCFYGPSLIRMVSQAPGQEIASHTFSHFYCRERGQSLDQFSADMAAARAIAEKHGYAVTSVILPRNECEPEYTRILRENGFTAYRDEENDWIHEKIKFRPLMRLLRLTDSYFPLTGQGGYIPRCESGIWNLTGSRMYRPIRAALKFLEPLKLARIKAQMRHAAKHGLTFHLWWHPHNIGVRTEEHLRQLEDIFAYYQKLRARYGMESRNMGEMVRCLEERE